MRTFDLKFKPGAIHIGFAITFECLAVSPSWW